MENKEFRVTLHNILVENGFEKIKDKYYRKGNGFLCQVCLLKSYFGPIFYVDFDFYLGEFEKPYTINRTEVNAYTPSVEGRFSFGQAAGYSCEYPMWEREQLIPVLLENMRKVILPPFDIGIEYLREHYGTFYEALLTKRSSEEMLFNSDESEVVIQKQRGITANHSYDE